MTPWQRVLAARPGSAPFRIRVAPSVDIDSAIFFGLLGTPGAVAFKRSILCLDRGSQIPTEYQPRVPSKLADTLARWGDGVRETVWERVWERVWEAV